MTRPAIVDRSPTGPRRETGSARSARATVREAQSPNLKKIGLTYLLILTSFTLGCVVGVECMAFTARKVVVHEVKVWARAYRHRAFVASRSSQSSLSRPKASIPRAGGAR